MPTIAPCLIHSRDPFGGPVVQLRVPLLDDYLEFPVRSLPDEHGAGGGLRPGTTFRQT
jgi:hypothetical protein